MWTRGPLLPPNLASFRLENESCALRQRDCRKGSTLSQCHHSLLPPARKRVGARGAAQLAFRLQPENVSRYVYSFATAAARHVGWSWFTTASRRASAPHRRGTGAPFSAAACNGEGATQGTAAAAQVVEIQGRPLLRHPMAHSAAPEAQAAPTLHPLHPLNALQPLHALHALHALRRRSTFQSTGSARPPTRLCCSAQGSGPQGRYQGRRSP